MKSFFAITLVALISVVSAKWEACHLNSGQDNGQFPLSFAVTGCTQGEARCNIQRSRPILTTAVFVTQTDIVTLTPKITAHALGQIVHYDLPDDILLGCNHLTGARCPIDEGSTVTYNFQFDVGNEYPLIDLNIEQRLFDQDGVLQFCVDVSSRVTA